MNTPGIKKYYIGFFILLGVAIVCLLYAVSQASSAKTDKKTNEAVQTIAEKLDTYVSTNGGAPESLQVAGITSVPDTIKYTKLGADQYKICIDYQTASSGFDAGWLSLLGGGFGSGSYSNSGSSQYYFDSTVQYHHKKGENCQTVSGYNSGSSFSPLNDQTSNSSSASVDAGNSCDTASDAYYQFSGETSVESINTSTRTIVFSPTGQTVKDSQGNSTPGSIRSKDYDDFTLFCDASGKSTNDKAVKSGQKIKFFASSDLGILDKVELE